MVSPPEGNNQRADKKREARYFPENPMDQASQIMKNSALDLLVGGVPCDDPVKCQSKSDNSIGRAFGRAGAIHSMPSLVELFTSLLTS